MTVLIEPDELAEWLAAPEPPVLADVRWTLGGPSGEPDFEAGHIPGAHWIDLDAELAGPPGPRGRHPLPDRTVFQAAVRRTGLSAERWIVVYDGANSMAAARLWWLLTDAGHERVRVLNGGFAAWRAAGLAIEWGAAAAVQPGSFVAVPGHRASIGPAEAGASGPLLVDVRVVERYAGEAEPIDPIAGHIPGAVNLPAPSLLETDGRLRPAAELAEQFAAVGVDKNTAPVFYCGSGITASQSLLALEAAGRDDGVLYPGSWSEWITDPARPIALGRMP